MNYTYNEAVNELERFVELMKDLFQSDAHRIGDAWEVVLQGEGASSEELDESWKDGYESGKGSAEDSYQTGYEAGHADCESEYRSCE